MAKPKITQKRAERIILSHNTRHNDSLRLVSEYGLWKVVQVQKDGGYLDISKPGKSGLHTGIRAALDAVGVVITGE